MMIEGPVFCLEEFRSLSDIRSALIKMASMVRHEINRESLGLRIKSVWLVETANSWTTRPDLMRFFVECDQSQSEKIVVQPPEYINGPSPISKIVEREIPFFIEKLNAN